jgi:hypothetical protein
MNKQCEWDGLYLKRDPVLKYIIKEWNTWFWPGYLSVSFEVKNCGDYIDYILVACDAMWCPEYQHFIRSMLPHLESHIENSSGRFVHPQNYTASHA